MGVGLAVISMALALWQITFIAGREGAAAVWQAGGFGWWPTAVMGVFLAYPVLAYIAAGAWYVLRAPRSLQDWPDWVLIFVCVCMGYRLTPGSTPESSLLLVLCVVVLHRLLTARAWGWASVAFIGVVAGLWMAQPNLEFGRAWAPVNWCEGAGSRHLEVVPITVDGSGVVGWAPQLGRVSLATNCRPAHTWVPSRTWFSYDDR